MITKLALLQAINQTVKDLYGGTEPGTKDDPGYYAFERFLKHVQEMVADD